MERLIDRFLRYVKIDTQSDHDSLMFPSTEKQKNLSRVLVQELQEIGLNAFLDDYGYVYAKIDKNKEGARAIGFVAHVDTSPDAPGKDVKPRIITRYDGSKIELDSKLSMDPVKFSSLSRVIGDDIVVTDGSTLLGADDKCGVAEIMELAEYFVAHPEEKHGD
ncbi:MAG: peptidase T, partial [Firmicutes bacterium]|nr:peptidase T [Bacillota bacterium]